MTQAQEINLLEKQIIQAELSPDYLFRWQGTLFTPYRAWMLLEKLYKKLKPAEMKNTLQPCKLKAAELSRKKAGKKYFVNVDKNGNCSVDTKFIKDSTIYCYRNGSQVSLDSKQKQKQDSHNLNTNDMATKSKATKENGKAKKATANLVTVKGLTYKGKPVAIPSGRAAKWQSFLKKPNAKGDGKVTINGLAYNKKPVFLPEGRASKWEAVLSRA